MQHPPIFLNNWKVKIDKQQILNTTDICLLNLFGIYIVYIVIGGDLRGSDG